MNYRTLGDITRQLKNSLVGASQTQEPLVVKTPVATPQVRDSGAIKARSPRKKK